MASTWRLVVQVPVSVCKASCGLIVQVGRSRMASNADSFSEYMYIR